MVSAFLTLLPYILGYWFILAVVWICFKHESPKAKPEASGYGEAEEPDYVSLAFCKNDRMDCQLKIRRELLLELMHRV